MKTNEPATDFQEKISELLAQRFITAAEQAKAGVNNISIAKDFLHDIQKAIHTFSVGAYDFKAIVPLPSEDASPAVYPYKFIHLSEALKQYEEFKDYPLQTLERYLLGKGVSVSPWLKPNKYRLYLDWVSLGVYSPPYLKIYFELTQEARTSPIAYLKHIGLFINITSAQHDCSACHPFVRFSEQAILNIETQRIAEQVISYLEKL